MSGTEEPQVAADERVGGGPDAAGAAGPRRSPQRGDIWDVDRMNHLHDLPRFCPDCGAALDDDAGIAIEYWRADRRIYHVWCRACHWAGDISRVRRMTGPQAVD